MAQQAGIIQGRILKVFINTVELDNQLDSSFTLTMDTSETTTKQNTGKAKTFQTDFYTGTGNCSGYVSFDATEGLTQAISDLKTGDAVTILWDTETTGNATYSSSVLVTSVNVTAPKDGPMAYSFDWQFTGQFTEATSS